MSKEAIKNWWHSSIPVVPLVSLTIVGVEDTVLPHLKKCKLRLRELKSLEWILEHEPPGPKSSVIFNVSWLMLTGWKLVTGPWA